MFHKAMRQNTDRVREKNKVRREMWQRKTNSGTFVCLLGPLDTGICLVGLVLGPKRETEREADSLASHV